MVFSDNIYSVPWGHIPHGRVRYLEIYVFYVPIFWFFLTIYIQCSTRTHPTWLVVHPPCSPCPTKRLQAPPSHDRLCVCWTAQKNMPWGWWLDKSVWGALAHRQGTAWTCRAPLHEDKAHHKHRQLTIVGQTKRSLEGSRWGREGCHKQPVNRHVLHMTNKVARRTG